MLGFGKPLLGGLAVPAYGFGIILRNPLADGIVHSEVELGIGIPTLCGLA